MKTLLVNPRDMTELRLVVDTLNKLGVSCCILSEDEKDDIASALMMREGERDEGKALVRKLYEEYS
jgi:hypothetical protein